jgi:hypothetical protein
VYGDGRLNDSGGHRLEVMAHDGAPIQITIARKYESTKKSKSEIEHQRGRLNYEEIPRMDYSGFWDRTLRVAQTGDRKLAACLELHSAQPKRWGA